MFELKTFKSTISIHPRCLCREWKAKFLEALRKEKERTVTQSSGAILEIQKITEVESPEINDSKIQVTVTYTAVAFSPAIGEVYMGRISLILPLGILIEAEGLVKVMILPTNMTTGYKFDPSRKVFSNGVHSYAAEDEIRFRITNIKYKPGEINCIGSIKDLPFLSVPETDDLVVIEPPDDFVEY